MDVLGGKNGRTGLGLNGVDDLEQRQCRRLSRTDPPEIRFTRVTEVVREILYSLDYRPHDIRGIQLGIRWRPLEKNSEE